jgi:hypothetical protein
MTQSELDATAGPLADIPSEKVAIDFTIKPIRNLSFVTLLMEYMGANALVSRESLWQFCEDRIVNWNRDQFFGKSSEAANFYNNQVSPDNALDKMRLRLDKLSSQL